MYAPSAYDLARGLEDELRTRSLRETELRRAGRAARSAGHPAAGLRVALGYRLVAIGWRLVGGAGAGSARATTPG